MDQSREFMTWSRFKSPGIGVGVGVGGGGVGVGGGGVTPPVVIPITSFPVMYAPAGIISVVEPSASRSR